MRWLGWTNVDLGQWSMHKWVTRLQWINSFNFMKFHHQMQTAISSSHDDVMKWKHVPCYWPCVRGIHRSPVNPPHKGQWHRALMFSLICARINGWAHNREAGNLRHHCAHHDATVMKDQLESMGNILDVMIWKRCLHYQSFVRGIYWWLMDFSHKWPVIYSFDIFFAISQNKSLSKQSCCWWFNSVLLWQHWKYHQLIIAIWL